MKKRYLTLFMAGCALAGARAADTRPNVVLIVADDLGYGDLKCYGAKNVETPAVDSLAKSGVRFTDMHAVAATSTPSRYSLLTGEYAWRKPGTDVAPGDAGMIIRPSNTLWRICFAVQATPLPLWANGISALATKPALRTGTRLSPQLPQTWASTTII